LKYEIMGYNRENIYAPNVFRWASKQDVCDTPFFIITNEMFELEKYLSLKYPKFEVEKDENNEKWMFNARHQCIMDTRRYEYPYCVYNTPKGIRKALDVGGGGSTFGYYMSERINEYHVMDIDDSVRKDLERMKDITGRFNNIEYTYGSVLNIPYPDNSFDCVYCISVLEHVEGKSNMLLRAFREMVRVVKPGMPVIVTLDVRLTPSKFVDIDDISYVAGVIKIPVDPVNLSEMILKTIEDKNTFGVSAIKLVK